MSKSRGIFQMIFNNFINTFKPRQLRGTLIGKDEFGNKYFEIAADPSVGKRKSSRWFEPAVSERFDAKMPSEWESWLRGRREIPPTTEEIMKNLAISDMKKQNAAELEAKEPTGAPKPIKEGVEAFPKYIEYEIFPGEEKMKKDS